MFRILVKMKILKSLKQGHPTRNFINNNNEPRTTSLLVAQWLEHPTDVRKVMGSIPVGDKDFFLSHACDN